MFFSLFSSLSLFFQLCCFSFLYCMPFLSLPLCVHDWILGQEQDTHCLQIHTTSWLSFTSWHGMCLVMGSAQQETKGNSVHFWVNNLPGPWEPFWFWGIYDCFWMPLVQFSCSVVSDSLWPHEMQHSRPSCPSPAPGVYPNSCPLSWWCHPTIFHPLLLPPSIFPSIRVFSNQSALHIR